MIFALIRIKFSGRRISDPATGAGATALFRPDPRPMRPGRRHGRIRHRTAPDRRARPRAAVAAPRGRRGRCQHHFAERINRAEAQAAFEHRNQPPDAGSGAVLAAQPGSYRALIENRRAAIRDQSGRQSGRGSLGHASGAGDRNHARAVEQRQLEALGDALGLCLELRRPAPARTTRRGFPPQRQPALEKMRLDRQFHMRRHRIAFVASRRQHHRGPERVQLAQMLVPILDRVVEYRPDQRIARAFA